MLHRDLPGFLCQGAKGSAARKGGRTVKARLDSVQVETQDGDDQLCLKIVELGQNRGNLAVELVECQADNTGCLLEAELR